MSRRALRAGEAIRQVVSTAILFEVQDPRVQDVTVIRVDVAGDMMTAKVYVSVMGDIKKQKLCVKGLNSCAGFLQSKLSKRIDTRYTPRLEFILDKGVKNQLLLDRILRGIATQGDIDGIEKEMGEGGYEYDEDEEYEDEE